MEPKFVFRKVYDENAKKWCISPNTLQTQDKFLILCDDEATADKLIEEFCNGTRKTPDMAQSEWQKLGEHINAAKTPIYSH